MRDIVNCIWDGLIKWSLLVQIKQKTTIQMKWFSMCVLKVDSKQDLIWWLHEMKIVRKGLQATKRRWRASDNLATEGRGTETVKKIPTHCYIFLSWSFKATNHYVCVTTLLQQLLTNHCPAKSPMTNPSYIKWIF